MTSDIPDMKRDWDARARENALLYIATDDWSSDEEFRESGLRDVIAFFKGAEHVLTPDVVLLDIGCGVGRMDEFLAARVKWVYGVDVSGEMIARANERLSALPNVTFLEGDGVSLGVIEDGIIDLAFSHICFHHCPFSVFQAYVPDVRRTLKPGGQFIFQMATKLDPSVPDGDDSDTIAVHMCREEDVWEELDQVGFERIECRHFPIAAGNVEYLRFLVRRGE